MANIQMSLEDPLLLEYAVAHIADFDFRPGFQSQGRIQRLECYFCISGTGHVQMDEQVTDLRAGMMFCSGAGAVLRKIWCNEDESLQVILLGCVGTEIEAMFHRAIGDMNCVFTPNNTGTIYETCKAMLQSAADFEPFADQICKNYLPVLMLQIQQGLMFEQKYENDNHTTYFAIKRFIDQHHSRVKHVEEVALEIGISHEYMCRLFKRYAHVTPSAYIMRIKMNHALHDLTNTNKTLKQIAYERGFANASAFSKAFKRIMGTSPSLIRT